MFLKKRGKKATIFEKPIWFLIDLLIAVIVFLMLLSYVDQLGESLTFERDFLAKDIALLVDTLYASPGSLTLKYPQNTFWFGYQLKDNEVQVIEKGLISKKSYGQFTKDTKLDLQSKELFPEKEFEDKRTFIEKFFSPSTMFSTYKPDLPQGTSVNLFFLKDRARLVMSDTELALRPDKPTCPDIVTQENTREKILLIDEGEWDKTDIRPQITSALALSLYNQLTSEFREIRHTRLGQIQDANTERNSDIAIEKDIVASDVVLGLYIGEYRDQRNVVKAFYSSKSDEQTKEKSQKLACLIVNRMLSNGDLGIGGVSIIESDNSLIPEGKVAVLLEIGNINKETSMVASTEGLFKLATSIGEGINEYFKN
jgi:hypothetical protein